MPLIKFKEAGDVYKNLHYVGRAEKRRSDRCDIVVRCVGPGHTEAKNYRMRSDQVRSGRVGQCLACRRYDDRLRRPKSSLEKRLLAVLRSAHERCNNPNNHAYDSYGARGLRIDARYSPQILHSQGMPAVMAVRNLLKDIGRPRGKKREIDRIDNLKGYVQGNLRWASDTHQSRNRRCAVTVGGINLSEAVEEARANGVRVTHACASRRVRTGSATDIEEAVRQESDRLSESVGKNDQALIKMISERRVWCDAETGHVYRIPESGEPYMPSVSITSNGYLEVRLGKLKHVGIHRLMALQHLKSTLPRVPMSQLVVAHRDDDKTNNRVSNLTWCTRQQNSRHRFDDKKQLPVSERINRSPLDALPASPKKPGVPTSAFPVSSNSLAAIFPALEAMRLGEVGKTEKVDVTVGSKKVHRWVCLCGHEAGDCVVKTRVARYKARGTLPICERCFAQKRASNGRGPKKGK